MEFNKKLEQVSKEMYELLKKHGLKLGKFSSILIYDLETKEVGRLVPYARKEV